MKNTSILFGIVLSLGIVASSAHGQPFEFSEFHELNPENGHVYRAYPSKNPVYPNGNEFTWQEAEDFATSNLFGTASVPGHLATIRSEEENAWLIDFMPQCCDNAWIGLFTLDSNPTSGDWEWISGEPLNYTNWRYHSESARFGALHLPSTGWQSLPDLRLSFAILEFVPPTPNGYNDFSGDGVPDAFEDKDGDGTPIAFEDNDGNGLHDGFQDLNDYNLDGQSDSWQFYNGVDGSPKPWETVSVRSSSHPNQELWYNSKDFKGELITWNNEPGAFALFYYLVNEEGTTIIDATVAATAAAVASRQTPDASQVISTSSLFDPSLTNLSHGTHWLHVRAVDGTSGDLVGPTTHWRINVNREAPEIAVASHPETPYRFVSTRNLNFTWTTEDVGSFPRYFWLLDQHPTSTFVPTDPYVEATPGSALVINASQELAPRGLSEDGRGIFFLHLISEDSLGNLSSESDNSNGISHRRVNIGNPLDYDEDASDPDFLTNPNKGFNWNLSASLNDLDDDNDGLPDTGENTDSATEGSIPQDTWVLDLGESDASNGDSNFDGFSDGPQDPDGEGYIVANNQAGNPSPQHKQTDISLSPILMWEYIGGGSTFNVFFGEDRVAVEAATTSSPEFRGTGAATFFSPGALDQLTTYYWRIDPVGGSPVKGVVWEFTTEALPPVADFSADPTIGPVPLNVSFEDSSTGIISQWGWDFNGDGGIDSTESSPSPYLYTGEGVFTVSLTISGPGGEDTETKVDYITVNPASTPTPTQTDTPTSTPSFTLTPTATPTATITPTPTSTPTNRIPELCVDLQQIYLSSIGELAELDASCSSDLDADILFYSWREHHTNPAIDLIPIGTENQSKVPISFPIPGRYIFEVQVSDGIEVSSEVREITVFVPGIKGVVGFSPSDGIVRVPDARIAAFASANDANSNSNAVDVALSDSLGEYQLENLSPANPSTPRDYFLRVDRSGFQSNPIQQLSVRPDPGPNDNATNFSIGRGVLEQFGGWIRDPNENPVQNAIIAFIPGIGGTIFADSADGNGNYSLSNVPEGSWLMQLRGPAGSSFQPETRDFNISGLPQLNELPNFHLSASSGVGSLSGQVFLSGTGTPIRNVRVVLGTGAETFTNVNGEYQFTNLPSGIYLVSLTRDGYEPARETNVKVYPGMNHQDFFLSFANRGPMVKGIVSDAASGRAIHNAQVGIRDPNGVLFRSDLTDYSGYYQLVDVPHGVRSLHVEAIGYVSRTIEIDITGSLQVNVQLERGLNWMPSELSSASEEVAIRSTIWSQRKKLNRNDPDAGDGFGSVLSMDGETIVFGVRDDTPGSAYVFERMGDDWVQKQKLTAPDNNDDFGISTSIGGDVVVVGAALGDSAYVFEKNGNEWEFADQFGPASGWFGFKVATNGETIAVASPRINKIDIFKKVSGSWTDVGDLRPTSDTDVFFGHDLAMSEDLLVVGTEYGGNVYIYEKESGDWVFKQTVSSVRAGEAEHFGRWVDCDGDTVVVGAPLDDDHDNNTGSAFVFQKVGETWVERSILQASDQSFRDEFGYPVAIDGSIIAVGARQKDIDGMPDVGTTYVFKEVGGQWFEVAKLSSRDGSANDVFGSGVEVGGDLVFVGSPGDNGGGGSAYVFGKSFGNQILFIKDLHQTVFLDVSESIGTNLRFSWRENPRNPATGLLPAGSENMSFLDIRGFPLPGIYSFEVQAESNGVLSGNVAVFTVLAPGLGGNVHVSPSDGVFGLNLATVRAYLNYNDAIAFNSNFVDSKQTLDNPIGDFVFDGLSEGEYWIVAQAQQGTGFLQYGPVKKRVNYSTASREMQINVAKNSHIFNGYITDSQTGAPLENVRVVVAPGILADSFRTTTVASGQFRLSEIPEGTGWPVMLQKEGYNSTVFLLDILGDITEDRTMTANTSGQFAALSGRITFNYQGVDLPIPRAEIILGSGIARTFTDGDGFYRFENLAPGDYFGIIRKEDFRSKQLADFGFVSLAPGENSVNRSLEFDGQGPILQGIVIEENTGEVIEGVEIIVLGPTKSDGNKGFSAPSLSDFTGFFTLAGIPEGNREIEVRIPGGDTYTTEINVSGSSRIILTDKGGTVQNTPTPTNSPAPQATLSPTPGPTLSRGEILFNFSLVWEESVNQEFYNAEDLLEILSQISR